VSAQKCSCPFSQGSVDLLLIFPFLLLQNEAYQLFWPEQPEFVRMAIKFGATIIPVGGVGSADSINLVRRSWTPIVASVVSESFLLLLEGRYLFFCPVLLTSGQPLKSAED
jgi:hypothetical protein